MNYWTSLGSHPDTKDLTPQWARLIHLVIMGLLVIVAINEYLATKQTSDSIHGLLLVVLGAPTFIETWFNRKNYTSLKSVSFKLFPSALIVLIGIFEILKP